MKLVMLLAVLCLSDVQFAQEIDSTNLIDQDLTEAIADTTNIKRLTENLVDSAESDFQKVEAIYQFVITHIGYDHDAYQGRNRRINMNNTDIMRRRKAVCWGYAELIREMCSYAGISCQTISGYANTLPIPSRALENANHAWNAVKLEGKWYLLDATWGSGVQFEKDYFTEVFGLDYFLTPPEWFIKNHFPLMPMWQLLDCPSSFDEFTSLQFKKWTSCGFNFQDSINAFLKLSMLEQNAKALMVAYDLNRTNTNRRQLGHALIDIAIEKKEKGDVLMEQDSQALAIEELEASLQIFGLSKAYCKFYPWQNEAYVFAGLNLAQAYYSTFYQDSTKKELIFNQFRKAELILNETHLKDEIKIQARSMLEQYLQVLE